MKSNIEYQGVNSVTLFKSTDINYLIYVHYRDKNYIAPILLSK